MKYWKQSFLVKLSKNSSILEPLDEDLTRQTMYWHQDFQIMCIWKQMIKMNIYKIKRR